jgi:hypothetical protein
MASLRLPLRTRATALLVLAFAALLSSCENPAGSDTGAAASLEIVAGDLQTGTVDSELPQALVVRVVDAKGKPVSGQVVNFRVTAGDGSVFAGAAATNADGEARERWTLGTVAGDTQRVEARAVDANTGQALVFGVFRAVGRADAPVSITPVGQAVRIGSAGFPLADSLAVKVLDRYGNGVGGATVAWTVRRGGGTVSPSPSTADAQGVAKAQWTLGTFVDSTQIVDASAAVGISTSFVASSGVPSGATLVVRAGDGQTGTVGTTLAQPVKVALLLPDGRPVVGAVIAWSMGSMGGNVSSATSVTDANGEATVQWTLPTVAGAASLWAETPGAVSVPFSATAAPGPAVALARVSGNGQTAAAGVPLADSLAVRADDAYGNAVPGVAVTWATSNGALSPASTTTRADGTARTQWTPATSGASSATATAAGALAVTFGTVSQGNVTFNFVQPGSQPVTNDVLQVQVGVQSTYSVTSVTAAVGDRTVALQRQTGSPYWTGQISLAGLPRGTYTLRVTATDATGAVTEGGRTFALDRRPTVEFLAPGIAAVLPAGSPVRVVAVCRDDDPAGCASLEVTRRENGTVPIATGRDSVDFTLSGGAAGDTVFLSASGTDTRGSTWTVETFYLLESQSRLTLVASVDGGVRDTDGARILYVGDGLRIRTLASGAEVTVPTPGNAVGSEAWRLTPRGAIFTLGASEGIVYGGMSIYEWRDGSLLNLGRISYYEQNYGYYPFPVLVEGTWAVWPGDGGLLRRDLDAGTNAVVYANGGGLNVYYAGYDNYDLAANGDVAFSRRLSSSAPTEIVRYYGGPVLSGPSIGKPRTDGVVTIASTDSGVVMTGPAGVDTLTRFVQGLPIFREYDANEGWAAWLAVPAQGTAQVWLRSPTGTDYNASSLFDYARLKALGPAGQVVFAASGRLWLYTPGGQPVEIASDSGRPVWRNGELYILLGNSVFRVDR